MRKLKRSAAMLAVALIVATLFALPAMAAASISDTMTNQTGHTLSYTISGGQASDVQTATEDAFGDPGQYVYVTIDAMPGDEIAVSVNWVMVDGAAGTYGTTSAYYDRRDHDIEKIEDSNDDNLISAAWTIVVDEDIRPG